MNDPDLEQRLAAWTPPAPSSEARERARHRAAIALKQAAVETTGEQRPPDFSWKFVYAGLAAVALSVVVAVCWQQGVRRGGKPASAGADAGLLAQVAAEFPGQLDAIIDRQGDLQLDLAPAPDAAATDQPLLVEFQRGAARIRVFSYSGRKICLDLGNGPTCFEALIGGGGEVSVVGEDFVWTTQTPSVVKGWQISAASLSKTI